MIHITEDKLRAAIQIALVGECENEDRTEAQLMHDIKALSITNVSGNMADKAQMINALTNTMAVNKNKLGCYNSLRDNSLEKLDKLIKSS